MFYFIKQKKKKQQQNKQKLGKEKRPPRLPRSPPPSVSHNASDATQHASGPCPISVSFRLRSFLRLCSSAEAGADSVSSTARHREPNVVRAGICVRVCVCVCITNCKQTMRRHPDLDGDGNVEKKRQRLQRQQSTIRPSSKQQFEGRYETKRKGKRNFFHTSYLAILNLSPYLRAPTRHSYPQLVIFTNAANQDGVFATSSQPPRKPPPPFWGESDTEPISPVPPVLIGNGTCPWRTQIRSSIRDPSLCLS